MPIKWRAKNTFLHICHTLGKDENGIECLKSCIFLSWYEIVSFVFVGVQETD